MVRIKDTESDGLTHKETLSGITKKIRIHKHTRRAPTSTDAGAGAGDGRGGGGAHSHPPVAVVGNGKADFSPLRNTDYFQKAQQEAGEAWESRKGAGFRVLKTRVLFLVVPLLRCMTTGE